MPCPNDLTPEADDAMSNYSSRMLGIARGEIAAPSGAAQLAANTMMRMGLFQPGGLFGPSEAAGSGDDTAHRSNDLTEADDAMSNISSRMSRLASGESAASTPGAQLSANVNQSRGQRQLTERESQMWTNRMVFRVYLQSPLVPVARSRDDTTHRSGTQQGGHD